MTNFGGAKELNTILVWACAAPPATLQSNAAVLMLSHRLAMVFLPVLRACRVFLKAFPSGYRCATEFAGLCRSAARMAAPARRPEGSGHPRRPGGCTRPAR